MKLLFILLLFVTQLFADEEISFDQWQTKFGIKFNSITEKNDREKIFLARKAKIEEHNANPAFTYKKSLNKFSHLESEEFINLRCKTILPSNLVQLASTSGVALSYPSINSKKSASIAKRPKLVSLSTNIYPFGNYNYSNAPSSTDFQFLMQPVQDQGGCASCWAFAAMGQLEGMMKIRNSSYDTVLGPQYLVDCDKSDGACIGGWPSTAMNWLKSNGNNAPSISSYPYKEIQDDTCQTGIPRISLGIKTVTERYFAGNEGALKAHIANYGPQAVAIYVTSNFQSYSSGVFYDPNCPSGSSSCSNVNHAVIVTGYGTDPVYGDYWEIKNSWDANWGENGYIRLARNMNNTCNIACWSIYSK